MKPWLARSLFGSCGALVVAVAAILFIATTESGARWALARGSAAAGGKLRWTDVDGTLLRGLRIDDVVLDDPGMVLAARRLEFAWQPWRLLDGTLVLERVALTGVRYEARAGGTTLTEDALRNALFTWPFAVEVREFRAFDLAVSGAGGEAPALDSVTGAATLDSGSLVLSALDLQRNAVQITGELRLAQDLALSGTFAWQTRNDGQTFAGSLVAAGSLRQIGVTHTLLQPVQVRSSGTAVPGLFAGQQAAVDLQHELPAQNLAAFGQAELALQGVVQSAGNVERIDIAGNLQARTEALAPLTIGFALTYRDGAVVIDTATATSTQIGLAGSGQLQLAPLALQFAWMLDGLDAGARLPQLQLRDVTGAGTLQLSGNAGAFIATLQLDALAGSLNGHPLAVAGSAAANASGLTGVELRAVSGANTLDLAGTAAAVLDLRWDLQAPALGELWQGLGGNVRGSGSIRGTAAAPQVNGTLTGANLRLERSGSTLALASLALAAEYGASGNDLRLQLDALTFTDADAVRVLMQQGTLTLTGTPEEHELSGSFSAPQGALQFVLQGAGQPQDWRGSLQRAVLDSDYGAWQLEYPAALQYGAGALSVAENCWVYLASRICGSGGKPAGQGFDAELALTALPLAWLNPAAAAPATKPPGWQALQDTFALNLPAGVLAEGELDARFAVRNLQRANGANWDSLDLVLQPRAAVLQLTQQLANDVQTLAPLVQRFGVSVNRSELHYADSAWTGSVDLQVAREEDSGSVAQGSLRGTATLQADGRVSGSADIDFTDLAWVESLLPEVREPAGMFSGSLSISGNRAQPQLQADLQVREGAFGLPAWGLAIHDVSLGLQTGADGVLRLAGSAHSGAGALDLNAVISKPLQPERALTAQVSGGNFLAFATDYATATISPRLQAEFAAGALTVNGEVEVADTELDLETVFGASRDTAVPVSRDVVVVRGATDTPATAQGALPVTANLVLRLGTNVHVRGYDLDAFLDGELTLEQTPGRPALVYGELGIPEGRYEIYNQQLSARDGRLLFFGNPANPVLDVRAFRETGSLEVGVLLTGNINDLQGQLYSTPTLPENEILAVLVTGKSFSSVDTEQNAALLGAIASFGLGRGQGLTQRVGSRLGLDSLSVGGGQTLQDSALGLGKYLTPDLLMRYKVGLFDRQSMVGIDYRLNEHLKLEVETGISQSVDLSYTIEKD